MNYNVKVIEYLDSVQVRTYKRPVAVKNKTTVSISPKENKERTKRQIEHSEASSVNRTVSQIYSISRSNHWEYFITLTINPKKLDSSDFQLITEKLNIWTNNLKKRYAPDLKYIIVPELHKDKTKWHFHGLFSDVGKIPFEFSGKTCVGKFVYDYAKKPFATKVYNLPLWKYGFSTATKVKDSSRASSYITKYITKDLSHVLRNQHRYFASQNMDKPLERVYNIDYDELSRIYNKYLNRISYVSNVKIPCASQEICYMEFNKNHTASAIAPSLNFSIFEPEIKESTCKSAEYRKEALPKKRNEPLRKAKTVNPLPSTKKYSLQQYIFELERLKRQLRENPDLKKLYSDLYIDEMISDAKREIYKRMEMKKNNEQTGSLPDGFEPAYENPFL